MAKTNDEITHLSSSTVVEGDITLENDIRIAGTVHGKIETKGALIIEATGVVQGEIVANIATIAGKVLGNIECSGLMTLESKASLTGDIRTRRLVINENAEFQGNCAMQISE